MTVQYCNHWTKEQLRELAWFEIRSNSSVGYSELEKNPRFRVCIPIRLFDFGAKYCCTYCKSDRSYSQITTVRNCGRGKPKPTPLSCPPTGGRISESQQRKTEATIQALHQKQGFRPIHSSSIPPEKAGKSYIDYNNHDATKSSKEGTVFK